METSRAERVLRDTVIPAVVGATAWSRAGEVERAAAKLCAAIYVGHRPQVITIAAIATPLRVLALVISAEVRGTEPVVGRDHPARALAERLLRDKQVGDLARSGELQACIAHFCGA
jgi:hypothetical protein